MTTTRANAINLFRPTKKTPTPQPSRSFFCLLFLWEHHLRRFFFVCSGRKNESAVAIWFPLILSEIHCVCQRIQKKVTNDERQLQIPRIGLRHPMYRRSWGGTAKFINELHALDRFWLRVTCAQQHIYLK